MQRYAKGQPTRNSMDRKRFRVAGRRCPLESHPRNAAQHLAVTFDLRVYCMGSFQKQGPTWPNEPGRCHEAPALLYQSE